MVEELHFSSSVSDFGLFEHFGNKVVIDIKQQDCYIFLTLSQLVLKLLLDKFRQVC